MIERDLEFPEGVLVTLTDVLVNRDFSEAAVKFSVFPTEKKEEVLQILNARRNELQSKLFKKLNIFFLPKIHFVFNEGVAEAALIEKLSLDQQVDK